jgi:hypothetical protein
MFHCQLRFIIANPRSATTARRGPHTAIGRKPSRRRVRSQNTTAYHSPHLKFPLRPSPQRAKRERQSQKSAAEPRPSRSGSNGHDAGNATPPPTPRHSTARGVAVDPAQQDGAQRSSTGTFSFRTHAYSFIASQRDPSPSFCPTSRGTSTPPGTAAPGTPGGKASRQIACSAST